MNPMTNFNNRLTAQSPQAKPKLTGQELFDYLHENYKLSKIEVCEGAGYVKVLDDGSHEPDYIAFYDALYEARKANGEYKVVDTREYYQVNGRDWYLDVLDDEGQELYDKIEEICPEFAKLDASKCQEFMDKLSEHGITTDEQFEDAYFYQTESHNADAEFAQYYAREIACIDLKNITAKDADRLSIVDRVIANDFLTIEFGGETYFLHKLKS